MVINLTKVCMPTAALRAKTSPQIKRIKQIKTKLKRKPKKKNFKNILDPRQGFEQQGFHPKLCLVQIVLHVPFTWLADWEVCSPTSSHEHPLGSLVPPVPAPQRWPLCLEAPPPSWHASVCIGIKFHLCCRVILITRLDQQVDERMQRKFSTWWNCIFWQFTFWLAVEVKLHCFWAKAFLLKSCLMGEGAVKSWAMALTRRLSLK